MKRTCMIPKSTLIDVVLFVFSIMAIFLVKTPIMLSVLVISLSVLMLWKVRGNSYLMLLFGIILYINFSTVVSEILGIATALGIETLSWQQTIRNSSNWLDGAVSMTIMLATLNVFINKNMLLNKVKNYNLEIKNNPIAFYIGYIFLWIIWLFFSYSAGGENGNYISNTSTLYEYCLVMCPVIWMYSNNEKSKKVLMVIYVIAYCSKSFFHGDRSSLIPMVLFLYFILFNNLDLKLRHVVLLAIIGILGSNVISIIRIFSYSNMNNLLSEYFFKYGASFLTSDTVSQSYYTSVVTQMTANDIGGGEVYYIDFIGAILFGGSFKDGNVSNIVVKHYMNKYGGFFYSWPYFWFGYVGVFLFSAILGFTLNKVYKKNSQYSNMLKTVIVIFSFRWYLYTCFDFFRGVLFVSSIMYFAFYCVDNVTGGRQKTHVKNALKK